MSEDKTNLYRPGDWNVICDRTGFQLKASECGMQPGPEGKGLFIRKGSRDKPHAQSYARGKPDVQSVPIASPPQDQFIEINTITPESYPKSF